MIEAILLPVARGCSYDTLTVEWFGVSPIFLVTELVHAHCTKCTVPENTYTYSNWLILIYFLHLHCKTKSSVNKINENY